ncbi:MAG: DNA repair exonuclease [Acidimicrobiales bacterium]
MADASAGSFRFVHAADLHLDTPFSELHELVPHVADELREASLAAFDEIVDLALERECAFVLFAGDIYDGAERGVRAQAHFRAGLELLSSEGISSFVVHGNHDPVETGWSAVSTWPERTTVFSSREVECIPVLRGDDVVATVQGISYASRQVTENLALRFIRPQGPGVHIGLLHCNVGSEAGHGNYCPCTVADLKSTRLDYWALGHIHAREIVAEGSGPGDPWIVYPGNTQARSLKRSERAAKGALVVQVTEGVIESPEFVPCDRVRFQQIRCPIDDIEDLSTLIENLASAADGELANADGRSLVLRARLTGHGPLHSDFARPGYLDGLRQALRDRTETSRPFLWWDDVEDRTLSPLSREEIRRRGDFASDLLAVADARSVDQTALRDLADRLLQNVPGIVTGELRAIVDDEIELTKLFERATSVALESISTDQQ